MDRIDAPWIGDEGDEAKVTCHCEHCGGNIYEGDEYYHVHEYIICEKCINKFSKTA